ncbi:cell fate (sporulation/competence/biofilm development) regulator YlbF (YheA/YmcA/DUF963 family) [Croceifilum oryzae]|uniref:Cell fate (Sporulation/competence/biofilm development) regulator YlbF (YheA/YmcA/DUF963 family) n=1 Tax=Croceifilum oryzae TaxID=1553429 RepID=A0AAJ1WST5_9BACL|nr:YlbF family regulator [Croceifilum oryzae]MDQ0417728.1 cell fate (sporulation/competence/biofilm development) regulator YlbF (YheA/YmcA/DUF963 family) [Croceifilum oryzae]
MKTIDMTELLSDAYDLADEINKSHEVQSYLCSQAELQEDVEAQKLISEFQKKKELYEETKRFGIFHPNYHEAKQEIEEVQAQLRNNSVIRQFLEAEERLDQLLYQISSTIAKSVSHQIHIPIPDSSTPGKQRRGACHP